MHPVLGVVSCGRDLLEHCLGGGYACTCVLPVGQEPLSKDRDHFRELDLLRTASDANDPPTGPVGPVLNVLTPKAKGSKQPSDFPSGSGVMPTRPWPHIHPWAYCPIFVSWRF